MCGIVGIFSRGKRVSEGRLQQATRSLFHRGPDGQRHWVSPDRRVGLGHARLSIIDLETDVIEIRSALTGLGDKAVSVRQTMWHRL
jgi:asparagine synthetase B (glutamine-hydrolysing)